MTARRALAIVFERDAGPGVFAQASATLGVTLDSWLFDGRTAPPGEVSGYDAVLVFGGSMHPDAEDAYPWLREVKALMGELLGRGTPLLGVCLGGQLLADAVGPPSRPAQEPELGWYEVEVTPEGERIRCSGRSLQLHGLRMAQVRVRSSRAAERRLPAAQRAFRPTGLARSPGASSFTRRSPARTPTPGSTTIAESQDAARIVADFDAVARAHPQGR